MERRVTTLEEEEEEEEGEKVGRAATRRIVGSTRTRDGWRGVTALIEWRNRAMEGGVARVGGIPETGGKVVGRSLKRGREGGDLSEGRALSKEYILSTAVIAAAFRGREE